MLGRPKKRIDKRMFESLLIRCPEFTREKIARILECDSDTLGAWCQRTYGESFSVVKETFYDKIQAELAGVIRDEAIKKRNTQILIRYAEKYDVLDKRNVQRVDMNFSEEPEVHFNWGDNGRGGHEPRSN